MIETVEAVRILGEAEQGRTRPLRAAVETATGVREVYLKIPGQHLPVEGLVNEMLGSLLAGDLNLPTPQPYFVRIPPELLEALEGPTDIKARLADAPNTLFGSLDAGSTWRRWNTTDYVAAEVQGIAVQAFAFDAFVANPDRHPGNPNVMKSKGDGRVLLIDHENAFGYRMKLFPPFRPWELGNLAPMAVRGAESEHVFYGGLAGKPDLDFEGVERMWSRLSDIRFGEYDALLPMEWEAERPRLQEAITQLKQVRDRMPECLQELRRVLA
ncbi:MAG: hypothetical protein K1X35_07725 [Caulobacteraceae bacterium]|nr:hypothetical protein [Caulobacteraceae bacterium]